MKRVECLMLWMMPAFFGLVCLAYWLFFQHVTWLYISYLVLLPVSFALVVVNLAGRFGIWTWTKPLAQVAFVYAGYTLLLYFLTGSLLAQPTTLRTILECSVVSAFTFMAIGTLFDIVGLSNGFFTVYNRAHYKSQGPVASALSYGFYYFGAYGFCFALSAKLGHFYLVESRPAYLLFIPISLFGLLLLFTVWLFFLKSLKMKAVKKRGILPNVSL